MPKNVLETEVLSLAGNHSGAQSSEKFLELSFSHTCWFSEYVAWLCKHPVHQHHSASDDQLQFMPRCTTEWVCHPWEVRALCLGRSEGRAGIGILSRPSLVKSEISRRFTFFRTFLNDWKTFILILISLISIFKNLHKCSAQIVLQKFQNIQSM